MLNLFKKKINNQEYGAFIVSKNVLNGHKIKFTFREKSSISQCNGWNIYSEIDDKEYVSDPSNFLMVSAETIIENVQGIGKLFIDLFYSPYGTDISWEYDESGKFLNKIYDFKLERYLSYKEAKKYLYDLYLKENN